MEQQNPQRPDLDTTLAARMPVESGVHVKRPSLVNSSEAEIVAQKAHC